VTFKTVTLSVAVALILPLVRHFKHATDASLLAQGSELGAKKRHIVVNQWKSRIQRSTALASFEAGKPDSVPRDKWQWSAAHRALIVIYLKR